jgi:hypothetical protein
VIRTARDALQLLLAERAQLRHQGRVHDAELLQRVISKMRRNMDPADWLDRRAELRAAAGQVDHQADAGAV